MGYRSSVPPLFKQEIRSKSDTNLFETHYRRVFCRSSSTRSMGQMPLQGETSRLGVQTGSSPPHRGHNPSPVSFRSSPLHVAGRAALGTTLTMGGHEPLTGPRALVVVGPSGAGKSTLIKRLMYEHPGMFGFSISDTTRAPRPGEVNGVDYSFTTRTAMEHGIAAGAYVEYAEVHGNFYGTRVAACQEVTNRGQVCLLDIDVQGAESVKRSSLNAYFVFVAPPSLRVLEKRLRGRGTETEASIQKRLQGAEREMSYMHIPGFWDVIVVNDEIEPAYDHFKSSVLGLVDKAIDVDVAAVCRTRYGQVLRKQSILKSDHFPSGVNRALPRSIAGAPNFRQIAGCPIYGVGQPTAAGVGPVIDAVQPQAAGKVLWVNCRDEPMIFLDGEPFCVKDRDSPFENIHRLAGNLPDLEEQLRSEILKEAKRYGGRILVHGETLPSDCKAIAQQGDVFAAWKDVNPDNVKTVRQIFAQHPKVSFWRWPIIDERAPEERDFEVLLDILMTERPASVVFNCQLGRGRTTTGMVIARLVWEVLWGFPVPRAVPAMQSQYDVFDELVRRLGAEEEHALLDDAIDACSAMQSLREGTAILRDRALVPSASPAKKASDMRRAVNYLERYVYLLLFLVYLRRAVPQAQGRGECRPPLPFRAWMANQGNARIYEILDRLHF